MKTNVGSYDVAVRFIGGCLVLLIGHHYGSWWGLVGVVGLVTAMFSFCPAYAILGIDTTACDKSDAPPSA